MSDLQRYSNHNTFQQDMEESNNGAWCLYDDHLVIIQDKYEKKINRLNAENDVLQKRGDMTVTEMRDGFESAAIETWKKDSAALQQENKDLKAERMERITEVEVQCHAEVKKVNAELEQFKSFILFNKLDFKFYDWCTQEPK